MRSDSPFPLSASLSSVSKHSFEGSHRARKRQKVHHNQTTESGALSTALSEVIKKIRATSEEFYRKLLDESRLQWQETSRDHSTVLAPSSFFLPPRDLVLRALHDRKNESSAKIEDLESRWERHTEEMRLLGHKYKQNTDQIARSVTSRSKEMDAFLQEYKNILRTMERLDSHAKDHKEFKQLEKRRR